MAEFLMPKLGSDMTAGTLTAWRKKPGDIVKRGDIVAEVETEKGVIEVEIFTSGVIEKLLVQPGEKVKVGAVLATVQEEQASTTKPAPPVAAPVSSPFTPSPRIRISPAARELAIKLSVGLSKVKGTGPDGAITREDVEKCMTAAPTAQDRQALMRETIAAAMSRSKREIPHYYLRTTINMQPALNWLGQMNQNRPITERLLHGALFIKAVALALREVPELNALWEGQIILKKDIHIGLAISLRQGGLIAPAIHYADQLSIDDLMKQMMDLVNRTRAGNLRSSELADPTITVTSLGDRGVESVYGVIYPPQVAIMGFGKVVERPWVVDGKVAPCPVVSVTLSADHRVSDGHRGGRFLAVIDRLLQEPAKL